MFCAAIALRAHGALTRLALLGGDFRQALARRRRRVASSCVSDAGWWSAYAHRDAFSGLAATLGVQQGHSALTYLQLREHW